ncbi:MAG: ribose-5-phosphate isomerase RpiA [Bryobacteraceae bacterium]
MPAQNQLKAAAAEAAAALVAEGMIVGLGSGSTAALAVNALGKRVKDGLRITGIPTSEHTAVQARALGIPLSTLAEHTHIDVTIDGADEVERGTLNLIKGHGGALLREKIIASASARLIVVVDESKLVERLGTHFAVPVEVVPFGWQATAVRLNEMGAHPSLRLAPDGREFVSDGGHYILDCAFGPISTPGALARELDSVVGLVEHGLFLGLTSQVIVGSADGVKTFAR